MNKFNQYVWIRVEQTLKCGGIGMKLWNANDAAVRSRFRRTFALHHNFHSEQNRSHPNENRQRTNSVAWTAQSAKTQPSIYDFIYDYKLITSG